MSGGEDSGTSKFVGGEQHKVVVSVVEKVGGGAEHDLKGDKSLERGDLKDAEDYVGRAFCLYFFACSSCIGLVTVLSILLWSSMGQADKVYDFLAEYAWCRNVFLAAGAMILLLLYLLDFFVPPHLPGHYLAFFEGDHISGPFALGLVALCLWAAATLSIENNLTVPLVIFILLAPMLVLGLRLAIAPSVGKVGSRRSASVHMKHMKYLASVQDDSMRFYSAAMTAFFLIGGWVILGWCVWSLENRSADSEILDLGNHESELDYLKWAAPAIVGFSNLIFGIIMMLRNSMATCYKVAEESEVIVEGASQTCKTNYFQGFVEEMEAEEEEFGGTAAWSALREQGLVDAVRAMDPEAREQFLATHKEQMDRMAGMVKHVGCVCLFMCGGVWLAGNIAAAESHFSSAALIFLAMFFFVYLVFIAVSFQRLVASMGAALTELPLFRLGCRVIDNDWARAAFVCVMLPGMPLVLLLSFLNQRVRLCRGQQLNIPAGVQEIAEVEQTGRPSEQAACGACRQMDGSMDEDSIVRAKCPPFKAFTSELNGVEPIELAGESTSESKLLTKRVLRCVGVIQKWNRLAIIQNMYILSMAYVCYTITPRALNVFLAWLMSILEPLPFGVICVSVVVVGLICFMLPPVPGVPVYLFCGLLVAGTYSTDPSDNTGFWIGACIGVVLGYIMKLAACAMQQKCIGELLGTSIKIQHQVGVHTEMIRAIEKVLRTPGFGLGKCCILCGGPDWPTSVLAGLLKLPLLQMEIGTLPIIISIAPCSLTGSLYIKQGEGETYSRLGTIMLLSAVFMNMLMWVGAAWAIQNAVDEHQEEIRKPLEKNISLDWLDYRDRQIAESFPVTWDMVPLPVKIPLVVGALALDFVGHAFYWQGSRCFGDFEPSGDVSTIQWFNCTSCMLKVPGLLGLSVAFVSFVALGIFKYWNSVVGKESQRCRRADLDEQEESWKLNRLREIQMAERTRKMRKTSTKAPKEVGIASFAVCMDTE